MAVVKWDPFRDLISIQARMNRLFEQTLSRSRGEEGVSATTWTPAVDIYETADTIVMKAELPGVAREDIQIQINDNTLTLKGERRFAGRAGSYTSGSAGLRRLSPLLHVAGNRRQDKARALQGWRSGLSLPKAGVEPKDLDRVVDPAAAGRVGVASRPHRGRMTGVSV
jgi:hypothetical protein